MRRCIGVIGKMGSGKDEVGSYLSKKFGRKKYELSSILKQELLLNNVEITRDNLIFLLKSKHKQYGKGFLAKKILEGVDENGIITGIRLLEQIEIIKQHSDSLLVFVDISDDIRFIRQYNRGLPGDPCTVAEMLSLDNMEENDLNDKKTYDIIRNKLADIVVDNNGTKEELFEQLDRIV